MGSGTSQVDNLHTDMTFDLASSGFDLHDEITQDQGQSDTKAGSLTEEVVIGGRSRSQESTTDLWVTNQRHKSRGSGLIGLFRLVVGLLRYPGHFEPVRRVGCIMHLI
ncbi:hypothetical protein Spb1_24560 [Planctopirus ephydatiae]|uniref:Uncharacterized protein n=1 Tax=Planctopirus ephydatiae TaxID=2528019 RepID=A0A518GPH4_9PLAN|nr:hypothetical protein [Planctopirus ephydatiae]QDV30522.1 hypothetical protein Spb1_24560 [Planctopirus ephydatiae]